MLPRQVGSTSLLAYYLFNTACEITVRLSESSFAVFLVFLFLFTDIFSDLFFFESHSAYCISSCPKVFSLEISFFASQSGNGYGAFSFQKSNDTRYRIFGRNSCQHMHMVKHHMSFQNFGFFLPCQFVKDGAEMFSDISVENLFSVLWYEYNMVFAVVGGMR